MKTNIPLVSFHCWEVSVFMVSILNLVLFVIIKISVNYFRLVNLSSKNFNEQLHK